MGRNLNLPNGKYLTVVALPDLHMPHNIHLGAIEKLLGDLKPDYLLYLGDALNLDSVSHWKEDKKRLVENERLFDDYAYANLHFDNHRKIVGKSCKMIYFIGNHEKWIDDYIDRFPQMESLIEVERHVRNMDAFVPFNQTWTLGHLSYMHGIYLNKYHAAKTVDAYMCNIIYGHSHDTQEYVKVTPQTKQPIKTKSVGCLCSFDMDYMKKRPSNWVNAFNVAYVRKDGSFNDYTINIINGKFTFNGRNY